VFANFKQMHVDSNIKNADISMFLLMLWYYFRMMQIILRGYGRIVLICVHHLLRATMRNLFVTNVFLGVGGTAGLLAAHTPVSLYVVMCSYNNERWVQENLTSVAQQRYPHWQACYINDCSEDKTGEVVDQFVKEHHLEDKIHVIHNKKRQGALANTYYAIKKAPPRSVVIIVDGDDRVKGPDAFGYIASLYNKHPHIWMTYGSYEIQPNPDYRNVCRAFPKWVIRKNAFRQYRTVASHLRTFYARLFQRIKKKDLMDNKGHFLASAGDCAAMLCMLEQSARGHFHYVRKVLYIYNNGNPINDFRNRKLQKRCLAIVRSRKPYKPLKRLF